MNMWGDESSRHDNELTILAAFEYVAGQVGASTDECRSYSSLPIALQDPRFEAESDARGRTADRRIFAVKLLVLFLVSYPLAGILKRLPDNKPYLKNIFNVV